MRTVTDIHPCRKQRLIMMGDALALVLPLLAWLSGNYFMCLMVLNVTVPIIHLYAIRSGIDAFSHWQGKWKCLETPWILGLSTTACFMMLVLLADWYLQRGWNIIGIYDNMLWSYMHYCAARAIYVFHGYIRKYG